MASSKLQAMWNHPAGPKTSWFISGRRRLSGEIIIANIADTAKPPQELSYPHQIGAFFKQSGADLEHTKAVAGSGLIWTRYGTVIKPKNWNLISVNFSMAVTGFYQLFRKLQHDNFSGGEIGVAKE